MSITFGVFSPSLPSCGERRAKIEAAIAYLEKTGSRVVLAPGVFDAESYKAGSPERRAEGFMALALDSSVDVLIATTGGYNSNEMLEFLDWAKLAPLKKFVVGYSDVTALLLALYAKTSMRPVSGAMMVDYYDYPDVFGDLREALESSSRSMPAYSEFWEKREGSRNATPALRVLPGKNLRASGPIVAANLSTFNLMLGTPYMPVLKGSVLFLEYDKEEQFCLPSIERFLWQLRLAGILQSVSALVFGAVQPVVAVEEQREGRTLEMILQEVTRGYSYPVLMNAPFGHRFPSWQLPLGVLATIVGAEVQIISELKG